MIVDMVFALTMLTAGGASTAPVYAESPALELAGCGQLRALAFNGVSQVVRCEPEHDVRQPAARADATCDEIRAVTLNGVSQVSRCEPEHGATDGRTSARRFGFLGR
jgi:hypothetical protein